MSFARSMSAFGDNRGSRVNIGTFPFVTGFDPTCSEILREPENQFVKCSTPIISFDYAEKNPCDSR